MTKTHALAIGLGIAVLTAGVLLHELYAPVPDRGTGRSASAPPSTVPPTARPFAFSKPEVPRPLPELRFVDGGGREMTLGAFRGRMVLLNIWATWCVPCREEMPALDRLQAELGGPDFQVVPLSIDRQGLAAVKSFYRDLGLRHLGIYVDATGRAAGRLGAVGIPATLLVDREGREVGRVTGPAAWNSVEVLRVLRRHLPDTGEGSNTNEP